MSDDLTEGSAKPTEDPVSRRGFLRKWLSRAALGAAGVVSAMGLSKPAGAQGWGTGLGLGMGTGMGLWLRAQAGGALSGSSKPGTTLRRLSLLPASTFLRSRRGPDQSAGLVHVP